MSQTRKEHKEEESGNDTIREEESSNDTIRIDEYIKQKKQAAEQQPKRKNHIKNKQKKARSNQWQLDLTGLTFNESMAAILAATLKSFCHRNPPGCFHYSYSLMSEELLKKTAKEVCAALEELKPSATQLAIINRIETQIKKTGKLPDEIKDMIGVTIYQPSRYYHGFSHPNIRGWTKMYFSALKLHRIEYHSHCTKFSYGSASKRKLKIQQAFLQMLTTQANKSELQQLENELNNKDSSLSTLNSQRNLFGLFKNKKPIHHYQHSLNTELKK